MERINSYKLTLKKFGIIMGAAFAVIALLLIIRHKHAPSFILAIAVAWFVFAFTMPQFLKPLYIIWMKFAFVLNWINTRIILFAIFYLIFAPIGLAMRLFGVDLLNKKIL